MLIEKITEDEIEFMQCWFTPECLMESLFSDIDNLSYFDEEKFSTIRLYQYAMISHENMIDVDGYKDLSEKERFALKIGAGDIINFGARKFGKSIITMILDMLNWILTTENEECAFSSIDAIHVRAVLEKVITALENHPILKIFKVKINRSPDYRIITKNGNVVVSVNMNLQSKNPGQQFFGKHVKRLYIEEASYETDEVYKKRKEALSEFGAVVRQSGMTNFTKHSPAGRVFFDYTKREKRLNLPQYCIAKDTKILMADLTYKNIQDVDIGDFILTIPEKCPFRLVKSKVINKFYRGVKETVKLIVDEDVLNLTPDHKVFVKNKSEDKLWLNSNQLKDYHKIYKFNYINNLKDYYEGLFLGILETEGLFKRNKQEFSIGQKDEKDCLESILKFLKIDYTKYSDKKDKDFFYYYIKAKNRDYINFLYSKLNSNRDVQFGFISGCIIGDGSINLSNEKLQIWLVQKNKVELINKILKRIRYNKFKRKDGTFAYFFPKFSFPFYAPNSKKIKKYLEYIIKHSSLNGINKRPFKIEKGNKIEVWDLTTEAGSFIANGIIVHNCNPFWDEKEKEDRIKEYGGENTIGYRVFVKGEVVEDGVSAFDMERIRKNCYPSDKHKVFIKNFEIGKDSYNNYKELIVVRRPTNAERILLATDIADVSTTEIGIFSKIDKEKYKYIYNISLYGLTDKQQKDLFGWLIEELKIDIFGIDCGDGTGRTIYRYLIDKFKDHKENFVAYDGSKNVAVDYERDENGDVIVEKGKIKYKEERMSLWAVKRLKDLLYEGKIFIPIDYKFDKQFNSVITIKTARGTFYHCVSEDDHLFDMFKVFAITEWVTYFKNLEPISDSSSWGLGV